MPKINLLVDWPELVDQIRPALIGQGWTPPVEEPTDPEPEPTPEAPAPPVNEGPIEEAGANG